MIMMMMARKYRVKNTAYLEKGRSCIALVIAFFVCMLFAVDQAGAREEAFCKITDIELTDYTLKVSTDGPIKYKLLKSADPFKVTLDLEGASNGSFRQKIVSYRAGITEVTPSQIDTPVMTSRLDILLEAPYGVKAEVNGNTLTIHVEREGKGYVKQAEKTSPQSDARFAPRDRADKDEAKEITAVFFDKSGEINELVIKGDGTLPDPVVFELDGTVMIDVPDIIMKAALPVTFPSQVKGFRSRDEKDRIRFVLDIQRGYKTEVSTLDDEIIVKIVDARIVKRETDRDAVEQDSSIKVLAAPKAGSQAVSLDFQDADIVPILRLLGDVSGYNIVIHPDVKGKITMKLLNVPWEQALDLILKTFALEKGIEGNIIRIASTKIFQEEKKAVAETKEALGKAEDVITKVFTVNYANVDKVKDSITNAKVLTPRGNISTDIRTRSIIIKDTPASLADVQKLIEVLDVATPQVLIEARIVEMNSSLYKSLGVEWGARRATFGGRDGIQVGGSAGSGPTLQGGQTFPQGTAVPTFGGLTGPGSSTMISLAASTSRITSPTAAVSLGYLNAAQTFGLDMRLSAIEANGKGKLLSNPRIMTLENEQAVIRHGKKIPVTTPGTTAGTFTTVYIDANLKLTVTPQVTPDGTMLLKIEVNKDEPDFNRADQFGNPSIDTRQAITQVLVKDGETVVIGGILKTTATDDNSGVPLLSKIPGLGWLFKKKTNEGSTDELIMFITPRIVKI